MKLGLCRDCPAQAREGKTKCIECFQKDIIRQEDWMKLYAWKKAAHDREKRYGVSIERYSEMFYEQNGRCGICGTFLLRPHLDHNHETGENRGILCSRCNTGLAFLENFQPEANLYLQEEQPWQISKKLLP
jgi:hypothetical protein